MKTLILAFVTLILGIVSAQLTLNDIVLMRAKTLEATVKQNVDEFKAKNEHLVSSLEKQLTDIQLLIAKMEHPSSSSLDGRALEAELLLITNRVNEEMISIIMAQHSDQQSLSKNELINQANGLVDKANTILKLAPSHDQDYDDAKHEVDEILELLTQLRALSDTSAELQKIEQQLYRHEQSLKVIFKRMSDRLKLPHPFGR